MKSLILAVTLILCMVVPVAAADGLINVASTASVAETANRLEQVLTAKGMTIFNRIKHSAAADKVGIALRETELIIFGNPKVGSLLMQCQQTVAIDLPQKALIWRDESNQVWISYNAPKYLNNRHNIAGCEQVTAKIEKVLAGIVKVAAGG